ncbi:MAG: hypothetical protein RAK24_04500 [TACK group archaeon]|nr:hypothetical protein [TACK group archaeon]
MDNLVRFYLGTTVAAIVLGLLVFAGATLGEEFSIRACCDRPTSALLIISGALMGFTIGLFLVVLLAQVFRPRLAHVGPPLSQTG